MNTPDPESNLDEGLEKKPNGPGVGVPLKITEDTVELATIKSLLDSKSSSNMSASSDDFSSV
jgi:hypothetical protein